MKKKYGTIESMAIVNTKTGKTKVRLTGLSDTRELINSEGITGVCDPKFGGIKATEDMLIRVVTRDEQGRRVTFFMS